MKEFTAELVDSDGNFILCCVSYNPDYVNDFRVLWAAVTVKITGQTHSIDNMEMIRAQYTEDILKQIRENK